MPLFFSNNISTEELINEIAKSYSDLANRMIILNSCVKNEMQKIDNTSDEQLIQKSEENIALLEAILRQYAECAAVLSREKVSPKQIRFFSTRNLEFDREQDENDKIIIIDTFYHLHQIFGFDNSYTYYSVYLYNPLF